MGAEKGIRFTKQKAQAYVEACGLGKKWQEIQAALASKEMTWLNFVGYRLDDLKACLLNEFKLDVDKLPPEDDFLSDWQKNVGGHKQNKDKKRVSVKAGVAHGAKKGAKANAKPVAAKKAPSVPAPAPEPYDPRKDPMLNDRVGIGNILNDTGVGGFGGNRPSDTGFGEDSFEFEKRRSEKQKAQEKRAAGRNNESVAPAPPVGPTPDPLPNLRLSLNPEGHRCLHCGAQIKK